MPEQLLTATRKSALERIEAAETLEQLEAVRVEVLGRKGGTLAAISNDFKRKAWGWPHQARKPSGRATLSTSQIVF